MNEIELWNKKYHFKKLKFDRLINFLKLRTKIVNKFHYNSTVKCVSQHKYAKEKLYFLFLDCLNAAGGNNLTNSAKATDKMIKCLDKLPNKGLIKFKEFTQSLGLNGSSTEELFKHLSGKGFKNFRFKKAALFLKNISYLQKSKDYKIFSDLSSESIYKPIPLDIIISEIVSRILGLLYKNRIKGTDGEKFNEWAIATIGKHDYYLLEDLWFWGYFSLKVNKKSKGKKVKRYRAVGLNEAKIITNPWVYPPNLNMHNDIKAFCKLIKSK